MCLKQSLRAEIAVDLFLRSGKPKARVHIKIVTSENCRGNNQLVAKVELKHTN